ncbi:MAG: restriction endonuclease subunit S [Bryobacterales bacterium]|nr:restriction endonuclease subunit S [Bryobacterales bacterium]
MQQSEVASMLDRATFDVDELVGRKRRLIGLLEEKRAALISRAVTQGLDPGVRMKDSGVEWLGRVPAHWQVCRMRHVIKSVEQGWSPQCDNVPAIDGQWGVLKAGCCNLGRFDAAENKALPSGMNVPINLEVRSGDLLMSRASGSVDLIGSVALVPNDVRANLLLSDKLYRLRVVHDVVEPEYLALSLGCQSTRDQIRVIVRGAPGLANNIAQSDVRDLWLCVPPRTEQASILRILRETNHHTARLTSAAERTIALLGEYRSALIAAAVTGQLDLKKHEKTMEALA